MAKCIMIQGTMSGAGKSLLAAALCRIFKQDGYRVAPFKSQNMALNSFITDDGKEMGRAQVMQAEAAGIVPQAIMNPVLLKPTTDVGSQVIVNGEVVGNMKASDYFIYKKQLIPEILKAYRKLEESFDIIVIEGAGSPAELNLKSDDIVNMGMAKMADAPVLLVGDIDRGGVFAQLIGTVKLLEPEEQKRIQGLVVNKFRGDRSLFDEGVRILEERSGKKVVGVLPYLKVDLEEEDSLSEKLIRGKKGEAGEGGIDIAVIRLPKISNDTDFDVFTQYEGVQVRYVKEISEIEGNKEPDFLLIPGTKNTIADCRWLKEKGFDEAVRNYAAAGKPVMGICGGYQILGKTIEDREGVETSEERTLSGNKVNGGIKMAGLGLLPADTVFGTKKVQKRVKGTFRNVEGIFSGLNGMPVEGYEIHMGVSRVWEDGKRLLDLIPEQTADGCPDGYRDGCCRGNVFGTYVHGIFDAKGIADVILKALAKEKGCPMDWENQEMSRAAYKERQYDRLAAAVREAIDLPAIYEMMGIR